MIRDLILKSLPKEVLSRFCRQWKIRELALFGSVLREDFGPQSDMDVLVTFEPDADWSLLDHVRAQQELEAMLGREVDLVSRRAIERSMNWIRREAILGTAETIYAAG
ncbi:MAG TPA: nucleotidyltransferase domain-containing protein [Thermoanaerobaculia bacterium]|nr:nucleotidyltransferase domain-containing protein [Thermoanaerobaculia bacterium]